MVGQKVLAKKVTQPNSAEKIKKAESASNTEPIRSKARGGYLAEPRAKRLK